MVGRYKVTRHDCFHWEAIRTTQIKIREWSTLLRLSLEARLRVSLESLQQLYVFLWRYLLVVPKHLPLAAKCRVQAKVLTTESRKADGLLLANCTRG